MTFDELLKKIDLDTPGTDLFDTVAEGIAKTLESAGDRVNRSAQIRRFYDEVLRFTDKHQGSGDLQKDKASFERDLPFIRMICARAAYAESRQHVDRNFVNFMQQCLRKVEHAEHLRKFQILFEAVIAYFKKRS